MCVWLLREEGMPIHLEEKTIAMDGLMIHEEGGLAHVPHIVQNGTILHLRVTATLLHLNITMTTTRDSPHHLTQDAILHHLPLITVVIMGVLHRHSTMDVRHLFMSGNESNVNPSSSSSSLPLLGTDLLLLHASNHHAHSGTETGHCHLGNRDLHNQKIKLTWR